MGIVSSGVVSVPGACQEYGLLRTVGGVVIACDTKRHPTGQHPRSWADFWNVRKFPGRRALANGGSPLLAPAAALLTDGVPPDELFPMDLDRTFRAFSRQMFYDAANRQALEILPAPERADAGHLRAELAAPGRCRLESPVVGEPSTRH